MHELSSLLTEINLYFLANFKLEDIYNGSCRLCPYWSKIVRNCGCLLSIQEFDRMIGKIISSNTGKKGYWTALYASLLPYNIIVKILQLCDEAGRLPSQRKFWISALGLHEIRDQE